MTSPIQLSGKGLAAAAVIFLAVVLAVATTMARGTGSAPLNASALAQNIAQQTNEVTPRELAQWLIEKRPDFQLVDVRAPWKFDDYHIPTAVNIPLATLFVPAGLNQLSRGKKIVLYDEGTGGAAQAQLLLSMKGYNAYSVHEGINGWWYDLMTPTSLQTAVTSPAGYLQAKQLRDYFLGSAAPGGAAAHAAPAPPPASVPPPAPTQEKPPATKLKLGRGCS
ncbi:MAG TPA: rhodanese-like domain-containing protein [Terriglobales bacterium]|nr:rhodanese-like domain-containing protein [Terriglobales bacterium]